MLSHLSIVHYKNIAQADISFSPKLNCFVGQNGQGKTNVLDAIYYLSFTKSAYNAIDSLNITHEQNMAMIQGIYTQSDQEPVSVTCALRRGQKKQFRLGKKDYHRLLDHIGLLPLVMVSPSDEELIHEGSDERRRFMDSVIAQLDRTYLEHLTTYNSLLKQRNALLKHLADLPEPQTEMLEVYEQQMLAPAAYIYQQRSHFIAHFIPYFEKVYSFISEGQEQVSLKYLSQLQDRDLAQAFERTRARDLILGWTSQGIHKDDIEMQMGSYPLKQVASQGQQKTYILSLKLAQALYLSSAQCTDSVHDAQCTMHDDDAPSTPSPLTTHPSPSRSENPPSPLTPHPSPSRSENPPSPFTTHHSPSRSENPPSPILLLDDIFDKLDARRVARIIELVQGDDFGQIFLTDTDRQHLTTLIQNVEDARIFHVHNGEINP